MVAITLSVRWSKFREPNVFPALLPASQVGKQAVNAVLYGLYVNS